MTKQVLLYIALLGINYSYAFAQQEVGPLEIGKMVPSDLWKVPLELVNHSSGKKKITLSEFKGKLIILDFWATWCGPCISNFSKLHELQEKYGDRIKVLAVTHESRNKIENFFQTDIGKQHTYINSVVSDTILSRYFPHKAIPHICWIDSNGVLLNITEADEVNKQNIESILNGIPLRLVTKFDIDRDRPLFISEHFGNDMEINSYSIFAKGYYPGIPSGNKFKATPDGKIYGRQMTNATMMNIYRAIISSLFEKNGERFSTKRSIVEVKDPAWLKSIKKIDGGYEKSNLYNYELIVPKSQADSLFSYMLQDLNRYSDYNASIEKREVDCLILVRTSFRDKIKSKGSEPYNSFPSAQSRIINNKLDLMLDMINGDTKIRQLILNETDYYHDVDIEISDFKDLESLRNGLKKYDLDLIPAKRIINMFVLKDK